jgi:molybdopterin converting factor small subunit
MVRIRFFGTTADVVGKHEIPMLTEDTTVAAIADRLLLDYPSLARLDLKFAVNQEYASTDSPVGWMDELAIFTAVSGG